MKITFNRLFFIILLLFGKKKIDTKNLYEINVTKIKGRISRG